MCILLWSYSGFGFQGGLLPVLLTSFSCHKQSGSHLHVYIDIPWDQAATCLVCACTQRFILVAKIFRVKQHLSCLNLGFLAVSVKVVWSQMFRLLCSNQTQLMYKASWDCCCATHWGRLLQSFRNDWFQIALTLTGEGSKFKQEVWSWSHGDLL